MTVLEVIKKTSSFLAKKEVDSPRLQAELLLAHVLKLKRMDLYLNFDRILNLEELAEFRTLVTRRGRREPLQHILGSANFLGLELAVTPHVLIPRPETEILAVRAAEEARNRFGKELKLEILDFGTGSGCLAISLATELPAACIIATDISPAALDLAVQNSLKYQVQNRITFVESDCFEALQSGQTFHLIVSNPPYIPFPEIASLQLEVRDFDPHVALDGGIDGLHFYRIIAAKGRQFLRRDGRLLLEFGDGQEEDIRQILELEKWVVEAVEADYSGRHRFLLARPEQ